MASGRPLTAEELERIRELRADGFTCAEVAEAVGLHKWTVRRHAPGRPGKVPVTPLREAFLAQSRVTAADVARELGWWCTVRGYPHADVSRVRRTLGLLPDIDSRTGKHSFRTLVDAETVERIAEAIGVMPWEVMPDDEEDAA